MEECGLKALAITFRPLRVTLSSIMALGDENFGRFSEIIFIIPLQRFFRFLILSRKIRLFTSFK